MTSATGSTFVRIARRVLAVMHVAGLLALLPAAVNAQTQCTITANVASISFNPVSTGRDTPAGTPISEVRTATNSVFCPANPPSGYYLQAISNTPTSSVVPGVWETGTPGIGIRVIDIDFENNVLSAVGVGSATDFGPGFVGANSNYTATFRFTYQLIKTEAAAGTGQVSIANMYHLQSHNIPLNIGGGPQARMALGATPFTVRSCTVTTPNITVSLVTIGISALGSTGASAAKTPFSIGLQCDTGGAVYITLTDATNPGNVTDVLTLTGDSTARGVGIRIRNPSSNPVSFGPDSPLPNTVNQWLVGPSDSLTSIPMTAEYVATGAITPGTVRAVATFTMSYQ